MSPENFAENYPGNNEATPQVPKTQEELEAKFGTPKVFGSLALAAAALMAAAPQTAEAGGASQIEVNSPSVSRLQNDLRQSGVTRFDIIQSMGTTIVTEKGKVVLSNIDGRTPEATKTGVSKALEGVTAKQFLREIERQSTDLSRIKDKVDTKHGIFSVDISPYAQEVLNESGVTYKKGILSKGAYAIDLTGSDQPNPNSECKIKGYTEFNNFVVAACQELKVLDGRPQISTVTYKISGVDLSVEQIENGK